MEKVIRFFITIILLGAFMIQQSCITCISSNYKNTEIGNNTVPKKTKIWYITKSEDLYPENLVDTNAIYYKMNVGDVYGGVHIDTTYHFYRFFGDGKMFVSSALLKKPSNDDANDITNGLTGYYLIKEGELVTKIFSSHLCGSYIIEKVKILKDSLVVYKTRTTSADANEKYYPVGAKGYFKETHEVYFKLDVGELYSRPDW